jgi:amidohydrolase
VAPTVDFIQETKNIDAQLVEWRRDFHRHPELAFSEQRSAKIIADLMTAWGYEVQVGIAETGLHARLPGKTGSEGVLLRVDMDALPIHEKTGVDYASIHPGVMHACGHDGHMAIGLGVGMIMRSYADQLSGDLHIIFQPAEEGRGGAERMINEGLLEGIQVETALGVHLWNERPIGWFGVSAGSTMAAAERFELRVKGRGGHGGMPNLTRDPVVASAAIIAGVQSIVARNVDPLDSAVISFTHIEGGSNFNVVPDEVFLEGTIRTLTSATRSTVLDRFRQATMRIAEAHACELEISTEQVAPAVVNEPERTAIVRHLAEGLFPNGDVQNDYRVMVSEDMALFLEKIPGVFIFVGSANEELGLTAGHHTADFNFDESAMSNAVALLCAVIWEKLKVHD